MSRYTCTLNLKEFSKLVTPTVVIDEKHTNCLAELIKIYNNVNKQSFE